MWWLIARRWRQIQWLAWHRATAGAEESLSDDERWSGKLSRRVPNFSPLSEFCQRVNFAQDAACCFFFFSFLGAYTFHLAYIHTRARARVGSICALRNDEKQARARVLACIAKTRHTFCVPPSSLELCCRAPSAKLLQHMFNDRLPLIELLKIFLAEILLRFSFVLQYP